MAKSAAKSEGTISAKTRVLVLHGQDAFLQDERLRQLRDALTEAHGEGGYDTVRFEGATSNGKPNVSILADMFDECRSMGLMQQHKVVVVNGADILLKEADEEAAAPPAPRGKGKGRAVRAPHTAREMMEAYVAAPSDGATLVLRAGTWRPGNLDKAISTLGEAGAVLKCEPPTPVTAVSWAIKRCSKRHGCEIEPAAAGALVEAVGADLGRIDTELEKLATAAGGAGEPITVDLVKLLTGVSREDEFWSIQEKLLAGAAAAALAHLRELIDVSRHDPVPLTFSYVDLARKIHAASRMLADGAGTGDIIRGLKLWGATIDLILGAGRAVKPAAAERLLDAAIRADAAGKSGLGDPERNLEVLTVKFTDLLGADRRR